MVPDVKDGNILIVILKKLFTNFKGGIGIVYIMTANESEVLSVTGKRYLRL